MSRTLARPKRAAEDFARPRRGDAEGPLPSKKPRFDPRNPSNLVPDALEEDTTLEADVIGTRGQQVKRNAVNIDGYDSDSDNDGFDVRAAARRKETNRQGQTEEENDMFADLEDDIKDGDDSEGEVGRREAKKKAVRFLDEAEIEGQIPNSKSGGHVSADFSLNGQPNGKGVRRAQTDAHGESSSESEVDEETRAAIGHDIDEEVGAGGKKTHAPKLDAFNMRNEQEDGRFDDQGNYVRKVADPDAVHDSWLEGLSKKDMKQAREAAEKRENERRQKNMEDDAVLTADLLKRLIPLLEQGETILEALARIGTGRDKKPKWQSKNKKRKQQDGGAVDTGMAEEDAMERRRKELVGAITGAADLLMTRGQTEIYDAERELLIRQYERETGQDWVEPSTTKLSGEKGQPLVENKQWEYRWSDERDGGETYGPYNGSMMARWQEEGYFGDEVEFRRIDAKGGWSRAVDFL